MYVWWSVCVSLAGTELLDLRFMMDEDVEELIAFRLHSDGDVLLCDKLLGVQCANLSDCVSLETILDVDGVETMALHIDETGTVDKIMLPVEDDGILGISAMEDTGKLVRETLQPVTEVPETEVMSEEVGEVSDGGSPDNTTILFAGQIFERTILAEEVETVGRAMLLVEADGKFDASDDVRLIT